MPGKPSPRKVAAEVLTALRRAADSAVAAQARTYFKEPVDLLGVRAPHVRRIARETYARVKSGWDLEHALDLCEVLLADKRLEAQAVGLLVVERFRGSFDKALLARTREWIEKDHCDSWAVIDTLCGSVLGPLLGRYPELVAKTRGWTASPNRWLRRAAAVSLTGPARRGKLLDEAYDIASLLLDDADDLVQKACGWLLREAGKTDMRRLQAFLHEHGRRCARTTVRYAIERFPAAVRRRLLEETRAQPVSPGRQRGGGASAKRANPRG